VQGVPAKQPDVREEKKGPRVGAPKARSRASSRRGSQVDRRSQGAARQEGRLLRGGDREAGRPAIEVIGEIVPEVVKDFPWPKSMRWGEQSAKPGALGWVRPLHSIVATFGPETEEPDIVRFAVDGITAGDETRGHRFMAPEPFKVRRSTTTGTSSRRPRWCSTRSAGRRSSSPTPRTSPLRRATS
jgi:glycyl-tRNA synthetase beta chain